VSSDGGKAACRRFALWWVAGFGLAGAIGASLIFGAFLGGGTILGFIAMAILGAIIGLLVGVSIAQGLALLAGTLGWDENPPSFRVARIVRCLDHLLDIAGP
jgi:Zn-dependent protease with chaperone function